MYADAPGTVWWGLVASAVVYQLGPAWTLGLPVPAVWLGPRLGDRHAAKCASTRLYPLRQAVFLLKTFGGACWGADPTVRRLLGQAPLPAEPDAWRTS